ncbi:MAG: hypothetical protein AAFZ07_21735 [Actinomycetota bacterium]
MADGDLEPLDLLLYAPLGAAIELRSRLPELASSGRRHLGMQVLTARSIGQFAVTQARRQLPSFLDDVRERGVETLSAVGLAPPAGRSDERESGAPLAEVVDLPVSTAEDDVDVPGPDELAIPDYDSLSALQVVPRLEGLDPEELSTVDRYESAHRARRTILHRISQLRGEVS